MSTYYGQNDSAPTQSTPPGVYKDPESGLERYWDGIRWSAEPERGVTTGLGAGQSHIDTLNWGLTGNEETRAQQAGRVVRNTAVGVWNVFAVMTWIVAGLGLLLLLFS